MSPTMEFRWLRLHGGDIGFKHPMAIRYGDSGYFHVLQQKWSEGIWYETHIGINVEWRDVPVFWEKTNV